MSVLVFYGTRTDAGFVCPFTFVPTACLVLTPKALTSPTTPWTVSAAILSEYLASASISP